MAWASEARVDCISPANLSLLVYRDDVLFTTESVVVTPNVRSLYRVPLPHSTKARRLRLVLKATNPAGSLNPGFECYYVSVRHRGTGKFVTLYDALGDAA